MSLTLIDTHAHLYLPQFDDDRAAIVQSAMDNGVKKIYLPNIDKTSIESMLEMEAQFPNVCVPMMGLHPCSVGSDVQSALKEVRMWLDKRSFVAVGEIGTDLYWDKTYKAEQEEAFRTQIRWAIELDIPIVIHSRETLDWNIQIVKEEHSPGLRGIFHCFNGSVAQSEEIAEMGFHIGLGGVITFKNSGMSDVVPRLRRDICVLETDAPYLTPTPHRGKRNESSYTRIVAEKLAEFWDTSIEEVSAITSTNAEAVFGR